MNTSVTRPSGGPNEAAPADGKGPTDGSVWGRPSVAWTLVDESNTSPTADVVATEPEPPAALVAERPTAAPSPGFGLMEGAIALFMVVVIAGMMLHVMQSARNAELLQHTGVIARTTLGELINAEAGPHPTSGVLLTRSARDLEERGRLFPGENADITPAVVTLQRVEGRTDGTVVLDVVISASNEGWNSVDGWAHGAAYMRAALTADAAGATTTLVRGNPVVDDGINPQATAPITDTTTTVRAPDGRVHTVPAVEVAIVAHRAPDDSTGTSALMGALSMGARAAPATARRASARDTAPRPPVRPIGVGA